VTEQRVRRRIQISGLNSTQAVYSCCFQNYHKDDSSHGRRK